MNYLILQTLSEQSRREENQIWGTVSEFFSHFPISETVSRKSFANIFPLSWSHYVILSKIDNQEERSFYEIESAPASWSVRELQRQSNSGLFEINCTCLQKWNLKN